MYANAIEYLASDLRYLVRRGVKIQHVKNARHLCEFVAERQPGLIESAVEREVIRLLERKCEDFPGQIRMAYRSSLAFGDARGLNVIDRRIDTVKYLVEAGYLDWPYKEQTWRRPELDGMELDFLREFAEALLNG